jgi:hypothetical protein
MKHLALFAVLMCGALILGCSDDEESTPTAPTAFDVIVGSWKAEGLGYVAPGLYAAPFRVRKIVATFNNDKTYTVVSTDSAGASITYTGSFTTADGTGSIRNIVLNQATPTTVTSTGIYQVVTDSLTYEVIQTSPAIPGFTAPTTAAGFGSTAYNNFPLGQTWIQRYKKQ